MCACVYRTVQEHTVSEGANEGVSEGVSDEGKSEGMKELHAGRPWGKYRDDNVIRLF